MAVVDEIARVAAYLNLDKKQENGPIAENLLTKYEFNQIIGLRTLHLSKGAPPLVELAPDFRIKGNMELRAVALREMREKRLPYLVRRVLPNGKPEYKSLSKMDLAAVRHLMRDA